MSGWPTVPILDAVEDVTGGNPKLLTTEYLPHGAYPVIDQGAQEVAGYTNDESLLCRSTGPLILFGDHTCIVKYTDSPFALGADGVKVLKPRHGSVPRYLYWALKSIDLPDVGYSRHFKFLKDCWIPLPPLEEQRRIAAILDRVEQLRTTAARALDAARGVDSAVYTKMFPPSRVSSAVGTRLVDLCVAPDDIKCGPFGTQLAKHEVTEAGVPLWGIKNVNTRFTLPAWEFVAPRTADRLRQYSLVAGDIVMTRKGTMGNCAVYPSTEPEGVMHSDLLRVRVDATKALPEFLAHQLHNSREIAKQVGALSGGAVMPGINVGRLKQVQAFVPPLAEQREFVRRVRSTESLIHRLALRMADLVELTTTLTDRAFKGEL